MSGMQYGFLTTLDACDEAIRTIGFEILEINNALARIERGGGRTLTDDEHQWIAEKRERLAVIKRDRNEIRDHKRRLNDQKDELFDASFKVAAREMLDDLTYARLVERAQEIEVTSNERREAAKLSGSALGVKGNSGGMRVRR